MMAEANFHFHAELNDLLSPKTRLANAHNFVGRVSIKDMIESQGIPHTEVAQILVNGKSVDFFYIVQDQDCINVYPVSKCSEVTQPSLVRPKPLLVPRFVLDIHLGKLATSLRMLGLDTLYRNDYTDEQLAYISCNEELILLTRDRGLLMRSIVTYGYYVRETNPQQQVIEVLQRFNLFETVVPLRRCLRCNGLLEPVAKEKIIAQLPPKIRQEIDEFHCCSICHQIYWKGTHYEQMKKFIEGVLNHQRL